MKTLKIIILILLIQTSFFYAADLKAQTYINVLVNQPEKLQIIADELYYETENSFVLGESVIVDGGTVPYSYSWFQDNMLIGDELSMEILKPVSFDFLEFTVKDAENCSDTKTSDFTDVEQTISELSVLVYPNPASNYIIINPNDIISELDVLIFDNKGNNVINKKITEKTVLNMSLKQGIYLMKIEDKTNGFLELKKLIIL
ncbi:MAG: T9SS type A sorting domain-containing protein [Bacteroidales bacterium]|nr:T9SS type A sorting domain-containing protein [Bacteroidales bacterium]MDD4216949.1 T9SS type A sorting domain-containing protein [Bacteroidales bacterium]MDY0140738.1 T9SS type A sorting domain-containing protein [Bacteroidales bacterium]